MSLGEWADGTQFGGACSGVLVVHCCACFVVCAATVLRGLASLACVRTFAAFLILYLRFSACPTIASLCNSRHLEATKTVGVKRKGAVGTRAPPSQLFPCVLPTQPVDSLLVSTCQLLHLLVTYRFTSSIHGVNIGTCLLYTSPSPRD